MYLQLLITLLILHLRFFNCAINSIQDFETILNENLLIQEVLLVSKQFINSLFVAFSSVRLYTILTCRWDNRSCASLRSEMMNWMSARDIFIPHSSISLLLVNYKRHHYFFATQKRAFPCFAAPRICLQERKEKDVEEDADENASLYENCRIFTAVSFLKRDSAVFLNRYAA